MLRFLSRAALLMLSTLVAHGATVPAIPSHASAAVPAPATRAATQHEVALLNDVLHRTADDYRRWAYTEHRVLRDNKGRLKSDVLLRYDPSKPYAEQWNPIRIDGREPTDRERAKYRRRGEQGTPATAFAGTADDPRRRSLGELIDVGGSFVQSESATHWVFEVPLRKADNERFPPEKFQVLARVRKEKPELENIAVRLRESFRSKLIVKVKSGEGSLDFAPVDARYPAALVAVEGDAVASVLFVSIGGSMNLKRSDLKHVKPFDERFDVQIGSLKAIDF